MGYYINPPDCSKEDFLSKHGEKITPAQAQAHDFATDTLPVCWVNNGAFTAAGIGYSPAEVEAFAIPDGRSKEWYLVPKTALLPYYEGAKS